jgi:phage terminase large subunit GpA-like protein
MMTTIEKVLQRTRAKWAPPPDLSVSEWADTYRMLSPESSAEPGRWHTARVPYMREVMDAIGDRRTEVIVVQASAQIAKTEMLLNALGYFSHLDAAPVLFLQPTLQMAEAISKDRLAPMIRTTPELAALFGAEKSRSSTGTLLHKAASNGARITLAGANSPASLAGRPIRVILADELDRWPVNVGEEGSPLALAMKRTTTFRRRKILVTSTPTVAGGSQIEAWHELSDQRQWNAPCPRCSEEFVFEWEHVRFEERDPASACIECPHCQGRIEEHERLPMIAKSPQSPSRVCAATECGRG